jgi:hypothetical protein
MPWPEPLAALLRRPDSRAAQALRWGLHGLRAALQAALPDVGADAGGDDLRAVLAELVALLDQDQAAAPTLPASGPAARLPDAGGDGLRLPGLARAVAEDQRFQSELRRRPVRTGDDDEIWNDVQRLMLRVPAATAEAWRRRCLDFAAEAGARPDGPATAALPLAADEVLYPGLAGAVRAAGLRSSPAARLDPRVAAPGDAGLRPLAGVVSACLWFVENDPHLFHCLKGVFRFGLTPLTGEQRERYISELLRIWERVRAGGPGVKDRVKARLDLDEAIHSLVYQPPAAPGSWWGRLQAQARATLFAARDQATQAGCPVHLQALGGSFAEINRLAPDSLQVDFGPPGDVCACLRVWARVDGEELKGRVLYRSPEDGDG